MLAIGVVIVLIIVALTIWAIVTKCGRGKSAKTAPEQDRDVEQNRAPPVTDEKAGPPDPTPEPPWKSDPSRLPPGIVLTPVTPPTYDVKLRPRQATDPPYERLALVSSRVHNAEEVAKSLLPNVAYVVYDWKNFTLQELLHYIKKALDGQKVASIAVIAPGSKPGSVGLLEGSGTSAEKLSSKAEVSQFWRALAGCLQPQPQAAADGPAGGPAGAASTGRGIDLLGCRVTEVPEGAALLKELSDLTDAPVAAADDAQGGYKLSTYKGDSMTKQLGLAPLDILAMDLYFDRARLLCVTAPDGSVAAAAAPAAAAMTRSAPPTSAVGTASAGAAVATVIAAASGQPEATSRASPPRATPDTAVSAGPPAATPPTAATAPLAAEAPTAAAAGTTGSDIFTRLDAALKDRGKNPQAVFDLYDRDGNGQLSTAELTALMRAYVPDATTMDIKHFQAMLDTDATPNRRQELLLSREEFVNGLPKNVEIQRDVREGRDKDGAIKRLQDYLEENEKELRPLYRKYDANGNGELDHTELRDLIADIPDFSPQEQKFVLAHLYHYDKDRDLRISLDELKYALMKASVGTTAAAPPAQQAGVAATEAAAQPVANQAERAEDATRAAAAAATDDALPAPADGAAEAAPQSAQQQAATEATPDLPQPRPSKLPSLPHSANLISSGSPLGGGPGALLGGRGAPFGSRGAPFEGRGAPFGGRGAPGH